MVNPMSTAPAPRTTYYVVPCSGEKVDQAAPAADLYQGQTFRYVTPRVQALADDEGAQVLILSAKYGLVRPEQIIEPYDQCMGAPGSITRDQLAAQVCDLDGDAHGAIFYAFLPRAYYVALDRAVQHACDVHDDDFATVQDVYEAAPGVGYMRGIANQLATP